MSTVSAALQVIKYTDGPLARSDAIGFWKQKFVKVSL